MSMMYTHLNENTAVTAVTFFYVHSNGLINDKHE